MAGPVPPRVASPAPAGECRHDRTRQTSHVRNCRVILASRSGHRWRRCSARPRVSFIAAPTANGTGSLRIGASRLAMRGSASSTSRPAISRSPAKTSASASSSTASSTATRRSSGELEQSGHRLRTRSDSEIALHLYEDLGAAVPAPAARRVRVRPLGRKQPDDVRRARPLRHQAAVLCVPSTARSISPRK